MARPGIEHLLDTTKLARDGVAVPFGCALAGKRTAGEKPQVDMAKGGFLNQKLGKRTSRRIELLKSGFKAQKAALPPQARTEKLAVVPSKKAH